MHTVTDLCFSKTFLNWHLPSWQFLNCTEHMSGRGDSNRSTSPHTPLVEGFLFRVGWFGFFLSSLIIHIRNKVLYCRFLLLLRPPGGLHCYCRLLGTVFLFGLFCPLQAILERYSMWYEHFGSKPWSIWRAYCSSFFVPVLMHFNTKWPSQFVSVVI